MVPFLMLALALVWQVVLIGLTSMFASHAAAEGARQSAVTPNDPISVNREALRRVPSPWDDPDNLHILTEERNGTWYTQVVMYVPVLLPGISSSWSITGEAMVVPEVEPRGSTS